MTRMVIGKSFLVLLGIALSAGDAHALYVTPRINRIMKRINDAVLIYASHNDLRFPDSFDEVTRFVNDPEIVNMYQITKNNEPILKEEDLLDTWGEPVEYVRDGPHRYIIRSSGPDKTMGTADDVIWGYPHEHVGAEWEKASQVPAVARPETNVAQTTAKTSPKDGKAASPPDRTATRSSSSGTPDTRHQTAAPPPGQTATVTNTPWKHLILACVIIISGIAAAWLCFKKKAGLQGD